jgi:hypothetical protein
VLAKPDPVAQSYSDFDKMRYDGNPCSFFWDISHDDDIGDNGFLITDKGRDEN